MRAERTAGIAGPPSPYRERRGAIVVIAGLAFVVGILETLTIVSLVAYIDLVASGAAEKTQSLGPVTATLDRGTMASLAVAAVVGVTIGQLVAAYVKVQTATQWQLESQKRAIDQFLAADWSTQSHQTTGRLHTVVLEFSWAGSHLINGTADLLNGFFGVLVLGAAAFVVEPVIAMVLAIAAGLLGFVLRPITAYGRRATAEAATAQVEAASKVIEMRELARDIRLAHVSEVFSQRVGGACESLMEHRRRASLASAVAPQIYRSLGFLLTIGAVVLASRASDVEIARVGVVGLLLLRTVTYGQRLQTAWQAIVQTGPYLDQLAEWWAEMAEGRHQHGTTGLKKIQEVWLRQVTYSYGGAEVALDDVDLGIRRGEMVGIVGPTGSGKSTIAQLLLGLRRPTAGSVEVDGLDSTTLDATAWHRQVGFVPQDPHLVADTVLENIRFYRSHVTEDDARASAAAAGLLEEIEAMPEGFATRLGGVDRDVSGGQRQRLGIARALAGSPELLVLDEPTSALDVLTERHIQDVLDALRGSVTVVIIAHRLSTLRRCDRIVVMGDGRVEASGPPQEVLASNDFYRAAVQQSTLTTDDAPRDIPEVTGR